jgi:hypothetical protein
VHLQKDLIRFNFSYTIVDLNSFIFWLASTILLSFNGLFILLFIPLIGTFFIFFCFYTRDVKPAWCALCMVTFACFILPYWQKYDLEAVTTYEDMVTFALMLWGYIIIYGLEDKLLVFAVYTIRWLFFFFMSFFLFSFFIDFSFLEISLEFFFIAKLSFILIFLLAFFLTYPDFGGLYNACRKLILCTRFDYSVAFIIFSLKGGLYWLLLQSLLHIIIIFIFWFYFFVIGFFFHTLISLNLLVLISFCLTTMSILLFFTKKK